MWLMDSRASLWDGNYGIVYIPSADILKNPLAFTITTRVSS